MSIIASKQLCQAFDPMMILPEKTYRIIDNYMQVNTSCFAPAYVLLEGSRGKRYLCDYHYAYERNITITRTPELWAEIEKHIVDEREKIQDTFAKNVSTVETLNNYCWCNRDAYVKLKHKTLNYISFFCNFHYRKFYYRNYSNGVTIENDWNIIDERYRMNMSIIEDSETVPLI